jgi:transposase-like protein
MGTGRSKDARRRLAQRWQESGASASAFALAHGLATSSLHRWAKELREEGAVVSPSERSKFMEIATVAPVSTPVRLVVGAVSLELSALPPAEYVMALAPHDGPRPPR